MIINNFDTDKMFDYENGFYTTANESRFGKLLAQYEIYKKIICLPGAIVECGLFRGNSFFRFAHFRDIFESIYSRKLIGFDTFGKFPKTNFAEDEKYVNNFINSAGEKSVKIKEIRRVMKYKNIQNYELIKGDIINTVPQYCSDNPHLKIALLHIDTDVYEPAVTILQNMFDRVVKNGIVMLDDYATFPGETKAVDEFIKDRNLLVQKLSISHIPSYIVKT